MVDTGGMKEEAKLMTDMELVVLQHELRNHSEDSDYLRVVLLEIGRREKSGGFR